jgi:hypothetical protein
MQMTLKEVLRWIAEEAGGVAAAARAEREAATIKDEREVAARLTSTASA